MGTENAGVAFVTACSLAELNALVGADCSMPDSSWTSYGNGWCGEWAKTPDGERVGFLFSSNRASRGTFGVRTPDGCYIVHTPLRGFCLSCHGEGEFLELAQEMEWKSKQVVPGVGAVIAKHWALGLVLALHFGKHGCYIVREQP